MDTLGDGWRSEAREAQCQIEFGYVGTFVFPPKEEAVTMK